MTRRTPTRAAARKRESNSRLVIEALEKRELLAADFLSGFERQPAAPSRELIAELHSPMPFVDQYPSWELWRVRESNESRFELKRVEPGHRDHDRQHDRSERHQVSLYWRGQGGNEFTVLNYRIPVRPTPPPPPLPPPTFNPEDLGEGEGESVVPEIPVTESDPLNDQVSSSPIETADPIFEEDIALPVVPVESDPAELDFQSEGLDGVELTATFGTENTAQLSLVFTSLTSLEGVDQVFFESQDEADVSRTEGSFDSNQASLNLDEDGFVDLDTLREEADSATVTDRSVSQTDLLVESTAAGARITNIPLTWLPNTRQLDSNWAYQDSPPLASDEGMIDLELGEALAEEVIEELAGYLHTNGIVAGYQTFELATDNLPPTQVPLSADEVEVAEVEESDEAETLPPADSNSAAMPWGITSVAFGTTLMWQRFKRRLPRWRLRRS